MIRYLWGPFKKVKKISTYYVPSTVLGPVIYFFFRMRLRDKDILY